MTRKRQPNQRRKTGNKTIFTNKILEQVELLTKLGATDLQLSQFFKCDVTTIGNWAKHEDFQEAKKRGGLVADMKVVQSLYKRAIGYEYEEIELIRSKSGDFITKVTQKTLVPDVKAITTWLGARHREQWTFQANVNHTHGGKIEHLHNRLQDIPVNELSKKAKDVLFEIVQKQLSNGERNN